MFRGPVFETVLSGIILVAMGDVLLTVRGHEVVGTLRFATEGGIRKAKDREVGPDKHLSLIHI